MTSILFLDTWLACGSFYFFTVHEKLVRNDNSPRCSINGKTFFERGCYVIWKADCITNYWRLVQPRSQSVATVIFECCTLHLKRGKRHLEKCEDRKLMPPPPSNIHIMGNSSSRCIFTRLGATVSIYEAKISSYLKFNEQIRFIDMEFENF